MKRSIHIIYTEYHTIVRQPVRIPVSDAPAIPMVLLMAFIQMTESLGSV